MIEKGAAALGDAPVVESAGLQEEAMMDTRNDNVYGSTQAVETEGAAEIPTAEENKISEIDAEMEKLLNEAEQNMQKPAYMDEAPAAESQADFDESAAVSTDTAVITAGMNITGDVTSSGNMDLIGSITGNIEILGKLNVTGNITGNSSAAEIYAESAQINGEIKSKGSVKVGQSSVVIGNIFASSAVIAGAVKGDIDVHGPVILDTSAIVMGNIKSKSVQINNGAVIEGMCSQCYADVSPSAFFNDVKKNRKQNN
ncbi:MAG: polymer-forming cytoskeletal protein [Lachnospiraceae bacterium]|nr:polymer-forming cytoskeletal protein [Lachnospiraceae bacterium]